MPPALGQPEVFAGRRDELPKPGSATVGVGKRIKGAFYHWQQSQFAGQAAFFGFIDNVMQVPGASFHHAIDVTGVAHVPVQLSLYPGIVDGVIHGETGAKS